MRSMAASVLGRIPEAFGALCDGLSDPNPEIRSAVAQALAWSQNPQAIEVLRPVMDDRDESVRISACEAVARLDRGDADLRRHVPELVAAAKGPNPMSMMHAYRALGAIGGPQALAAIREGLKGDAHVRMWALLALAPEPPADFYPDLRPFLDEDWSLQSMAVRLLARDPQSRERIHELTSSENEIVALSAVFSLAESGDPQGREKMEQLARKEGRFQTAAAAAVERYRISEQAEA